MYPALAPLPRGITPDYHVDPHTLAPKRFVKESNRELLYHTIPSHLQLESYLSSAFYVHIRDRRIASAY